MKRLLLLLLALAFCLTLAACTAQAPAPSGEDPTQTSEAPEDFTGKPTLQLRVNENYWLTADLTPYLGSEWAWVSFDVPMEYLAEGDRTEVPTEDYYAVTDTNFRVVWPMEAGQTVYIALSVRTTENEGYFCVEKE